MKEYIVLGEHALKIGSGKTPSGGSQSYEIEGTPLIRSQNVLMRSFSEKGLAFISDDQHEDMSGSEVMQGDVLLNITGASIGRVCIVPDGMCPANVNQHVCIIRTTGRIESEWLMFYLSSPLFQNFIIESQAGGTRQALSKQQILEFNIPNIGKTEQLRIAARLKAQLAEVEKARKAAEVQLKELSRLKTKMANELFSDAKPVRPVGVAAKVQSGYAFKSKSFQSEGIRLLRNANILPGKVYWDDVVHLCAEDAPSYPTYELFEGDVLISLDRPIISTGIKVARVSQNDLPALLLQRVGRFLINEEMLIPDYLYAYLHTDMFKDAVTGHDQSLGVPHISPKQVESILIPLPDLAMQNEIAAKMRDSNIQMQKAGKAAEIQLAEINLLPQKILSAAFGGAVD
jgi:type I restriction enzyme S subunit